MNRQHPKSGVVNRRFEITSLVADFNQDGHPDMIRVNLLGPAIAYIREGGGNHFVKVRLADVASSMGARVARETGSGKMRYDWLVTGEGLVSDQTHVLTFGLGEETHVRRVEVLYPDGGVETVDNPNVDTTLDLASAAGRAQLTGMNPADRR
jgi:hypothetical protein